MSQDLNASRVSTVSRGPHDRSVVDVGPLPHAIPSTCGQCVRVGDNSSMACDCFYQKSTDPACDQFEPTRQAIALAAWKASGSQSSARLSDSLLGDILKLAIDDFAAIYKSARGHQIDPVYVASLRHDMLIAIEAAAKAEARS